VVPHNGADPTDCTVNQFAMGAVAGGKRFSRMDIVKGEDLMFWDSNRHRSAGEKAQCGSGAHFKKSSPVGKKGCVAVHRRIFPDLSVLRAYRLPAAGRSLFGSSVARTSFEKCRKKRYGCQGVSAGFKVFHHPADKKGWGQLRSNPPIAKMLAVAAIFMVPRDS
jgi:hypothetical protein